MKPWLVKTMSLRAGACAALLLVVFWGLALRSSILFSPTFDEPFGLVNGLAWLTGTAWYAETDPPLPLAWSALPLWAGGRTVPSPDTPQPNVDAFKMGQALLYDMGNDPEQLIFLGRLMISLTWLATGGIIWLWARRLYGDHGSLVAVALFATDPLGLSNAALIKNDLPCAFFWLASLYVFLRILEKPRWNKAVLLGLLWGLALTTKFNASLLIAWFLVCAFLLLREKGGHVTTISPRALTVAVALFLCATALTIWTVYQFDVGEVYSSAEVNGRWCSRVFEQSPDPVARYVGGLTLPAPGWFRGFFLQQFHTQRLGHPSFCCGRRGMGGFWYFYIVAYFVKTPLPQIVLLLLALVLYFGGPRQREEKYLLASAFTLLVLGSLTPMTTSLRHILPTLLLLILFTGRLGSPLCWSRNWVRRAALILMAWHVVIALGAYPHYLAYFNDFVGGSKNGFRYFVDSNLDWGQDVPALSTYIKDHGIERIYLDYHGTASPDYYGIEYEKVTPEILDEEPPGWYAISATNLQDVYQREERWDLHARFRQREPTAQIGYSIFVYDLRR